MVLQAVPTTLTPPPAGMVLQDLVVVQAQPL
jgi:hypothetical protein